MEKAIDDGKKEQIPQIIERIHSTITKQQDSDVLLRTSYLIKKIDPEDIDKQEVRKKIKTIEVLSQDV